MIVTEAEYTYNFDNLRIAKKINGVQTGYIWSNGNMVAKTN